MATNTTAERETAPSRLIDAKAAGELLGVPTSWVLAEARSKRIPHIRLGRYVRFRSDALLQWALDREQGPVRHSSRPGRKRLPRAR